MATPRIAIARTSTSEQISQGLVEMILGGELAPGQPIRESVLAAELGVARNTVREAVRMLVGSGLVSHEMNRGAVVREPSAESLRDAYLARLAIEVGAATVAPAEALASAARDGLRRLHVALAAQDRATALDADLAFHAALVAAAGSSRLDAAYAPVLNELRLYLTILSVSEREYDDRARIADEHERIVTAVESGDRQRSVSELTEHIESTARRVRAIMERRTAG